MKCSTDIIYILSLGWLWEYFLTFCDFIFRLTALRVCDSSQMKPQATVASTSILFICLLKGILISWRLDDLGVLPGVPSWGSLWGSSWGSFLGVLPRVQAGVWSCITTQDGSVLETGILSPFSRSGQSWYCTLWSENLCRRHKVWRKHCCAYSAGLVITRT